MFGIEKYGNETAIYLLFGSIIVSLILYLSFQWKRKKTLEFAHIESAKKIFEAVSIKKRVFKSILIILSFIFLVIALMRPQGLPDQEKKDVNKKNKIEVVKKIDEDKSKNNQDRKVRMRESARDIIFLLDVSASMGAEDLTPNRLEKAKDFIVDIVEVLKGEHVGLVVFTSVPSVKCVLTLDYTYFKEVLRSVEINDNDYAGTKFKPALNEIINKQFDFSDNKYKELILITDGGDTELESLSGIEKDEFAKKIYDLCEKGFKENQIRIHTLGIGTKSGSILQGIKDFDGKRVKSSLNETFLQRISQVAKGVYIPIADGDIDLKKVYTNEIAKNSESDEERIKEVLISQNKLNNYVQKQKESEERKVFYRELYYIPLMISLLLLSLEFYISDKKRIKRK
ncbi:MAG: hypothetical protein COA79_24665 [Planctomycetota bacterium]|nr:MAG: hypothetical protein COA79_24665 [Planctomycetota bacterium]